jgi:hypothetical protein
MRSFREVRRDDREPGLLRASPGRGPGSEDQCGIAERKRAGRASRVRAAEREAGGELAGWRRHRSGQFDGTRR